MPKIAELKEFDGALWAKIDMNDWKDKAPISLVTHEEVMAIRRDEREVCIEIMSWYANPYDEAKPTLIADIVKRLRDVQ